MHDSKSSQDVSLLCTALYHRLLAVFKGCHVKLKSVIVQVAARLLCVCGGSSGVWREASMVMPVMDSHRQVALRVTTGTWTRVWLTYGNNKDPLCAVVNVACTFVVYLIFVLFSLCLVSQWTLTQKQQWWMLHTQPRRKLKCKQHRRWCSQVKERGLWYTCFVPVECTDKQKHEQHCSHTCLCTLYLPGGLESAFTRVRAGSRCGQNWNILPKTSVIAAGGKNFY